MAELKRLLTIGGAVVIAILGIVMMTSFPDSGGGIMGLVNILLAGVLAWKGFTAEPEDL